MSAALSSVVADSMSQVTTWLGNLSPVLVIALSMPIITWVVYMVIGAVRSRGR